MPIKMGGKTYQGFVGAAAAAARKQGVRDPKAYVASIERKQHPKKKGGKR